MLLSDPCDSTKMCSQEARLKQQKDPRQQMFAGIVQVTYTKFHCLWIYVFMLFLTFHLTLILQQNTQYKIHDHMLRSSGESQFSSLNYLWHQPKPKR